MSPIPSWLVQGKPLWLCGINENGDGADTSSSSDYIAEPFPEHELEPFGWRDILATLDVCANVHAVKHCDEDGYDIMSVRMVQVIELADESDITSGSYDEEIILEGPGADTSRI